MLYIICGLQGTGKSTFAEGLAEDLEAEILRTDVIRKELFPERTYSDEEKEQVYAEMFKQASEKFCKNTDLILDATFEKAEYIAKAIEISGGIYNIIKITCPEKIVKKRLDRRFGDESDAKFQQYQNSKKSFEPITEKHCVIDTSDEIDTAEEQHLISNWGV